MTPAEGKVTGDIGAEECILQGTCPLKMLWRAITGAGPESFDTGSFLGGVCFGAGMSIFLTKVLRGFFLVATGGLVTTIVLSHYGFISVNKEAIGTALRDGAQNFREKIALVLQSYGNPTQFLYKHIQHVPKDRFAASAVWMRVWPFGAGTAFCDLEAVDPGLSGLHSVN
ncbi:CBS domain-containing protein protein, putative [Babesia ovis]|uniref:CBS domain-containing protein protein, putative n=1 Tax=Babesia ovis TaxID=5869 RepID=A0A9W5WWA7_BABOV|nr:CBS domain-containing protein protein, putative [Babesia ovis]